MISNLAKNSRYETLMPIIVPRSYFALGNWPGRHRFLHLPELAITWVELSEDATMTYVNVERHEEIESEGFDVHELAMDNLRKASAEKVFTHHKEENGRTVYVAMMHGDGLGTSRLLLSTAFNKFFPRGYWFGIPERSCGVVVPKDVTATERDEAVEMVRKCYEEGTVPMLPGLYEKDELDLVDP